MTLTSTLIHGICGSERINRLNSKIPFFRKIFCDEKWNYYACENRKTCDCSNTDSKTKRLIQDLMI